MQLPLRATLLVLTLLAGRGAPATRVVHAHYPNGRTMWIREYQAGKESGAHQGWWPDGSKKFLYTYENGVLEGETQEWYASGQLYRVANYRRGQEEGPQRMWDADGTLRASYDVHDGRRYGSIGAMGCTPK